MQNIKIGLTGTQSITVNAEHTASYMRSGSLGVYATPAMVALMEAAAIAAITPHISTGQTSVGIEITVRHLAATPPGKTVRAEAEVTVVDGLRVTFAVKAYDEIELIGEGIMIRQIVETDRFMRGALHK